MFLDSRNCGLSQSLCSACVHESAHTHTLIFSYTQTHTLIHIHTQHTHACILTLLFTHTQTLADRLTLATHTHTQNCPHLRVGSSECPYHSQPLLPFPCCAEFPQNWDLPGHFCLCPWALASGFCMKLSPESQLKTDFHVSIS